MLRLSGTAFRSVRLNHALRTPVEGFDQLKFVTEQPNPFHTEQSKVTLNTEQYGTKSIRLITRPALHGIYCTIGLVLGAGSRYAGDLPAGICHLDEKFAFGPTDSFKTRTELGTFLDRCGGICDAQTDQESTIYALSIDRSELENGVLLLVESAFRPQISTDNVSEAFVNVENEVKYLQYERIRDKEVVELTIEAGYQMKNIGVPRSMSESTFGGFNADDWTDSVRQYRHANYLRSDPSIVGVGVTMDELERAVRKITHLIEKPSWESKNEINLDVEPAKWSGGFLHRDSSSQSFSIGGVENESYFSIGWKAASYTNGETETRHDRYVCHVLRALLGGGSAFESGGPGKGLKSFLYANVLGSSQGQHFSHFKAHYKEFTDSGIFTIYGQAHPKYLKLGVHIAQGVMRSIAKGSLTNAEVERAKTQLMNQYLRDMEVRAEMMEGFARETLAFEDPVNPESTCNHIRQVRKNDIVKMANQLLSNNPAIAILGESNETSKLYDDACKAQLNSRPLLGAGSVLISSAKGSLRGLLRL